MKKRFLSAVLLSLLALAGCNNGGKTPAGPQEPVLDPALVEARETKRLASLLFQMLIEKQKKLV